MPFINWTDFNSKLCNAFCGISNCCGFVEDQENEENNFTPTLFLELFTLNFGSSSTCFVDSSTNMNYSGALTWDADGNSMTFACGDTANATFSCDSQTQTMGVGFTSLDGCPADGSNQLCQLVSCDPFIFEAIVEFEFDNSCFCCEGIAGSMGTVIVTVLVRVTIL